MSRISWPSGGSTSAMRPAGFGGTGLALCSPPKRICVASRSGVQLSSRSGRQLFQPRTSSRRARNLQTEPLGCAGQMAHGHGLILTWNSALSRQTDAMRDRSPILSDKASFDSVCRRALAREPGGAGAGKEAGDVGFSANAMLNGLRGAVDRHPAAARRAIRSRPEAPRGRALAGVDGGQCREML
jgi:hypothetical protein